MIRSFSIIFGLEYLRLACSRRLGRYQQKTPRAVMAQGEQLSRSARVWTLGRFPFDSGRLWAALRPCARVLPSARPAVDACHWQAPPLASVQAPSQPHATRFFLSAVPPEFGPCPHSCPVTAGGRRAISCPGSGGPSRRAFGGLAPSVPSLKPVRGVLFSVTALRRTLYYRKAGLSRGKRGTAGGRGAKK